MSESRGRYAPEPSAPVPSPDPIELLRSRQYLGLLVLGALIGVPVAAIAFGFLKLVDVGEEWASLTLPDAWASTPRPSGGRCPFWWWRGCWWRSPSGTSRVAAATSRRGACR